MIDVQEHRHEDYFQGTRHKHAIEPYFEDQARYMLAVYRVTDEDRRLVAILADGSLEEVRAKEADLVRAWSLGYFCGARPELVGIDQPSQPLAR